MTRPSDDEDFERAGTASAEAAFPLTALQRSLVELQRARPATTIANVAMRWRVKGPLRDAAVEFALQGLVDRHEALRTRFVTRDGVAMQAVAPARIRPSIIDISRLAPDLAETEITRIATLEAKKVFDLALAPLMRCTVLRLSPVEAILLLTFHFAIVDGWSVGVIAREFASLAAAHAAGEAAELPEIELQFPDYALWQQETLKSGSLEESRQFWRRKLAGVTAFEVPHPARPRPAEFSGDGAIRSILLARALTDDLRRYSARAGQTKFALAAASLAVVLGREAGLRDVPITTPLANRGDPLLVGMVGPTVNTVVLRFDTANADDVPLYLEQCRATIAEAFSHDILPFEAASAAAGLKPLPGHPFVFGVSFTWQAANVDTGRAGSIKAGEIELISVPSVSVGALYDLNFFMVEREHEGWRISCEFNADIYTAQDTDRLLDAWRVELERVAAAPATAREADAPALAARPAAPGLLRIPARSYFRVVPLQKRGTRPPIFAFNNRSAYYPIARHFGTSRPFIDVQWREDAVLPELSPDSIPELAADAARRVREFDPVGPYYFMGHCMMGNVAFETARQLRSTGSKVLTLFLLDTIAPGYIEEMPAYDKLLRRVLLLDHSFHYFLALVRSVRRGEVDFITALMHYRFIRNNPVFKLINRRHGGSPTNYGNDIMNNGLMNYLRDAKGVYRYIVHEGDAVFFRSAEARIGRLFARDFGWHKLIGGDLRVYDVPGAHLEMTRDPGASVIAEHMAWTMDRVEGRWRIEPDPLEAGQP